MKRYALLSWIWPAIILLSVAGVGLVVFIFPLLLVRPWVVFWFLIVCPGAALLRFLHLQDPVAVGTLAVAISLSLDALIAGCQMYAGHWSPETTLAILMALTTACLLAQLCLRARSTWCELH